MVEVSCSHTDIDGGYSLINAEATACEDLGKSDYVELSTEDL
jgi:hypothetical protein